MGSDGLLLRGWGQKIKQDFWDEVERGTAGLEGIASGTYLLGPTIANGGDMWLDLAAITLAVAIGLNILALTIQYWE